jgi:hypothetical protein
MTSGNPATEAAPEASLAQSLAKGAAGTALLHIERAHAGPGSWMTAHAWLKTATEHQINASTQAGLYYGAPAISFILHATQADGVQRYDSATRTIDQLVTRIAEDRIAAANDRIDRGDLATFAEYDLFYGLTGLGVLLLHHQPESPVLPRLLSYLVRLTEPRPDGCPGWWAGHDPDPTLPTPGGHANFGMAHGTAGILAFLAASARRGHRAADHLGAISRLCDWFDQWRQHSPAGSWWPPWISRGELNAGRVARRSMPRPSWCYGATGIFRSLQLAGIALGDTRRQLQAENDLARCVSTTGQIDLITDPGLCHGIAGVYQTCWRAARDSLTPAIGCQLPALSMLLRHRATATRTTGLLDGSTGTALALRTAASPGTPPRTGWDTCLLIA